MLDVAKGGTYEREFVNDPERCEYFVPIRWLQTVPLENAVKEIGFFGNQNSVCKPTTPKWRATVERVERAIPRLGKTLGASWVKGTRDTDARRGGVHIPSRGVLTPSRV